MLLLYRHREAQRSPPRRVKNMTNPTLKTAQEIISHGDAKIALVVDKSMGAVRCTIQIDSDSFDPLYTHRVHASSVEEAHSLLEGLGVTSFKTAIIK